MRQLTLHLLIGAVLVAATGCFTPRPDSPLNLELCPGYADARQSNIQYQAYLGAVESLDQLGWKMEEVDSASFMVRATRCKGTPSIECYAIVARAAENGTLAVYIPERVDQMHLPPHWIKEIEWKYSEISCDLIVILEKKIKGKGLEGVVVEKPTEETDEFDELGTENETAPPEDEDEADAEETAEETAEEL